MKNKLISSWVVLAISVTSLALTACNDDNETPKGPGEPDAALKASFPGTYTGHATIVAEKAPQKAPSAEPIPVEAIAGEQAVEFEKFPVGALIEAIVGEEQAAEIIEAIGEVEYAVNYEILRGASENTLSLVFSPEPLEITMPLTPAPHAESPDAPIVRVVIASPRNGVFEGEKQTMQFSLTVESVTVGGEPFEIKPMELAFELGKAKPEHHS